MKGEREGSLPPHSSLDGFRLMPVVRGAVAGLTDLTDSYSQPLELCAIIALVGSAAAFLCKVPAPSTAQLMVQESSSSAAV